MFNFCNVLATLITQFFQNNSPKEQSFNIKLVIFSQDYRTSNSSILLRSKRFLKPLACILYDLLKV